MTDEQPPGDRPPASQPWYPPPPPMAPPPTGSSPAAGYPPSAYPPPTGPAYPSQPIRPGVHASGYSYPAAPPPGSPGYPYPPSPAFTGAAGEGRLRTSRILATAAQLALLLPVVALFWVGHAIGNQRDELRRALNDLVNTGSVDESAVHHADDVERTATLLFVAALIVAAALFIWWLWRMREDADWFDPYIARRAKGWVIGGWIVPVVSFWFPYQIVGDVAKANQPLPTSGYDDRQVPLLVKLWWFAFLVMLIGERVVGSVSSDTVSDFNAKSNIAYADATWGIVATVLGGLVINLITKSNAARWAAIRAMQPPAAR